MPRVGPGQFLPAPGDGPNPDPPAPLKLTGTRFILLVLIRGGQVSAQAGDAWTADGRRVSVQVHRLWQAGWVTLAGSPGDLVRIYAITDAIRQTIEDLERKAGGRR